MKQEAKIRLEPSNEPRDSEFKAFGRSTGTAERMRLIVDAAAHRFEQNGFLGTSLQDIAEDVGITKAALYHYIDSKERLLFMIHDAFVSRMLDAAKEFVGTNPDPAAQLEFFVRDIIGTIFEYRPYVKAFFSDFGALNGELQKEISEKRDEYEKLVENCIANGVADGTFDKHLQSRFGALFLFGACNWVFQWVRPDGPLSADELAGAWHRMLLNGFGGREAG